jgi:hypothetical protein
LKEQLEKQKSIWVLTPIFGAFLFVVLYIIATLCYPGGSQVDKNSIGFSWTNNYWCNLLNQNAINGQPNPAKPIAMIGMFVLCVTLTFFWFLFPKHINLDKKLNLLIQISGTLALTLFATVGIFIGLYKTKWYGLFAFGLVNILLVALNNYVYYNNGLINYLPIIQKISFATFLVWVCSIDINLYRMSKSAKTA